MSAEAFHDDPRARLAHVLLALGVATRGAGDVADRLTAICRTMTKILGCDRSSIFLVDGDEVVPSANHGNPPDIAAAFDTVRFDRDLPIFAATLASADPIVVPGPEGSDPLIPRSLAASARIRSAVAARLVTSTGPAGIITAEFNETDAEFGEFDAIVVQGLAEIAALVLDEHDTRVRERALLDEIRWRAEHDDLTGLPNRRALVGWFEDIVENLERHRSVAMLLADLDRFKVVNDALGHIAGDDLLVQVAERFASAFGRDLVLVSRFGGDEFVVAAVVDDEAHAERLAGSMSAVLEQPVTFRGGQKVVMTASVGIALSTGHNVDVNAMLRDADAAMYVAKEQRRGRSVFAHVDHRPIVSHRFALEISLAHALESRQITPWFQPIVDLETSRIVAVEALARWVHPERGVVLPGEFLPSMAEMGLLRGLTDAIVEQAATVFADPRLDGVDLFVNLSSGDIDIDLTQRLTRLFPWPDRLVVEITEHDALNQALDVDELLGELRANRIRVALDDFGTGYSSLSMLAELPLDLVKLDRSLVANLQDERGSAVLGATARLGRALGLTVLAEGVEVGLEQSRLGDAPVDLAQGYLFGRPQTAAELIDEVVRRRSTPT